MENKSVTTSYEALKFVVKKRVSVGEFVVKVITATKQRHYLRLTPLITLIQHQKSLACA